MLRHADPAHDERRNAVEKVLQSKAFSRSDASRLILKFIVGKALAGNGDGLKEYTIAVEALGRAPDFDPKADSIVRIQMQRLRKRLEEYYSEEGAEDSVRIVIPSGHYIPQFRTHPELDLHNPTGEPIVPSPPLQPAVASAWGLSPRLLLGAVILLLAVVGIMGFDVSRASRLKAAALRNQLPGSLVPLWSAFAPPNDPPLIVYSNALFLADDYGDVYRASLSSGYVLSSGAKVPSLSGLEEISPMLPRKGDLHYFDLYSGTGEVVAAAEIARLLTTQNQSFSLERSGLVSYDDIRGHDVIFLGGSIEDAVLAKLPVDADLAFERSSVYSALVDRRSAPGQPHSYRLGRDQKSGEFQADYALIGFFPGVDPGRHILVMGGITTLGTQAAVEFVTSPAEMATLESMRGGSRGAANRSPYFQSLLEVQIRNGAIARIVPLLVRELQHK